MVNVSLSDWECMSGSRCPIVTKFFVVGSGRGSVFRFCRLVVLSFRLG